MNKITPMIPQVTKLENPLLQQNPVSQQKGEKSFSDVLETAIQDVDMSHRVSDKKLEQLVSGENVDIHGTMIALQEADISIRTMSAFRDKITDAYKNLINMAI